jgi:sarcosine oxidase
MGTTYDAIVIGLGGMGAAAALHLAARGRRVLGLERHTAAHAQGSSHGESRIIRRAYLEGPDYVPLLVRAYELWEAAGHDAGKELIHLTGGLMLGPLGCLTVSGSLRSAREHGLPHEILDGTEVRRRFPAFAPSADDLALLDPHAGYLNPEECVSAHLSLAARRGAELRFLEPAGEWTDDGRTVKVKTAHGEYEAGRLVIAAGAWAPDLLAGLGLPFRVLRQVMYWFQPTSNPQYFAPEHFPVFIWELPDATTFYGFPRIGEGVKAAIHGDGEATTPDRLRREVNPDESGPLRERLASKIPSLNGKVLDARVCMYTMTPDEHFIVGPHPGHPNVFIAAGFSGHGFKFASVIGEILADLATTGETRHPIRQFDPRRPALT